jgi:two-component system response regulator FlrC
LQEKEIERLGGTKPVRINVRILATTNRDLKKEVEAGNFREDLYYRLNVISIELPPLRDRKDDIFELVTFFIEKYCQINGKNLCRLGEDARNALIAYDWPGNVRELEHTIERAVVLCRDDTINEKNLFLHGITINQFLLDKQEISAASGDVQPQESEPASVPDRAAGITLGGTIADMERELILNTLKQTDGNRTRAAEMLGITVRTLRNKLNEYREMGIDVSGD